MLKRFYTKYVKQKLFYRILLCYTLIFASSVGAPLAAISYADLRRHDHRAGRDPRARLYAVLF